MYSQTLPESLGHPSKHAEREIQFRAALKSTGHDSTRGTRTHAYIVNVK